MDLSAIKKISVIQIALKLGLEVKNKKSKCFKGHDQKTPSLSYNVEKNYWHCFGCGLGGDGIKLVQSCLALSFKEACHWLSSEFGLSINYYPFNKKYSSKIPYKENFSIKDTTSKYAPDKEVYNWIFKSSVMTDEGLYYLTHKRGYKLSTLEFFNLKAVNNPIKFINNTIKVWGLKRVLSCGLAKETKNGPIRPIWYAPVIIFPFYDLDENVVYIQARQITNRQPKYLNLYKIKTTIYNLNNIRSKNNKAVFICEGVTDVLSAFEYGLTAVGVLGANAFKSDWVNYFSGIEVKIIPDGDSAGDNFQKIITNKFAKIGKSVQVVELPKGYDFTNFVKQVKNGASS